MTPEQYHKVNQLFHAALELAREDRADFLDTACSGDGVMRMEVERMLSAQEQAGSFLNVPATPSLAQSQLQEKDRHQLIGSVVGHYLVISKLGEGGMGEVLLAQDIALNRRVALKLLPPDFISDGDRLRRFEKEARAASALNHPNIVTIHEIGQATMETSDVHFIAQEFIDGQTLRLRIKSGMMLLPEALDVAVQIASALQVAHDADIIHRDIKPENIMLRPDGIVKILDFGLAKHLEPSAASVSGNDDGATAEFGQTAPGMILGTVAYMSPEQARGLQVDARSDVWSLGVVLYETLTGRIPFKGATMTDVIVSIIDREPQPISQLVSGSPPELERIVERALAKDRDERYQTIREMVADLKGLKRRLEFDAELARYTESESIKKTNPGKFHTEEHFPRHTLSHKPNSGRRLSLSRALLFVATLLAASMAAFLVWTSLRSNSSPPPNSAPERQISYSITVQKMRDGREYEAPFDSTGREIFESGWKFRLNFNSPQSGFVYLLNEGPTTGGAISYSLLFPSPSINHGSAQMAANQPIQTGWYFLSEHRGTERLWLIWSAQASPDLEAAKVVFNPRDKGVISDQKMLEKARDLLNKQSQVKPEVVTDKINERTDIKFRADSIVQIIELEHR